MMADAKKVPRICQLLRDLIDAEPGKLSPAAMMGMPAYSLIVLVATEQDRLATLIRGEWVWQPYKAWNKTIMNKLGIGTERAFFKGRDAGQRSGYLGYKSGKSTHDQGEYSAILPDQNQVDDQRGAQVSGGRSPALRAGDDQRGAHDLLILDPKQDPKVLLEIPPEVSSTQLITDPLSLHFEIISRWNSLEGITKFGRPSLTDVLARELVKRLSDPPWDWEAAMTKFPLAQFSDGQWIPTLEWFLKSNSVQGILDGNYNRAFVGQGKTPARRVGAGQTFDDATAGKTNNF